MCGIVAYTGNRNAVSVLIKGLKRLEYRGYDSAGVAIQDGVMKVIKKKGKVEELENEAGIKNASAKTGIGHTRWATHGEPNDVNAHPHLSSDGRIALVHNGIIENYHSIKKELENAGHRFMGETDTEVLVHFIEEIKKTGNYTLEDAVRIALNQVVGAYAIVLIHQDDPGKLIAARKGSPLLIGHGNNEYFIASDASPVIEYTNEVTYLDDNEMAIIHNGMQIKSIRDNITKTTFIQKLEMELESIEKGGYPHFMLKEIYEQSRSIADCMRGRLNSATGRLVLGGIREYFDKMVAADRIIMIACGTSWHSCLVAEYFFEEYCHIPVEVEYASEFRYRKPVIREADIIIAVSQSGETADTLAALEMAKSKGAIIFGVCNVVGSSIARASHEGSYTHAGPEIGVASTKAFTAQLTVLFMIGLKLAKARQTISEKKFQEILTELEHMPAKIDQAIQSDDLIRDLAHLYKDSPNFIYLGRGYNFPVALEGALKLKEISYIHAEGYPAAEMKHGPIALIDNEMPVVFIALNDSTYDKLLSNIQEVKSRKGRIIAIISKGDKIIPGMVDHFIEIPLTIESLSPLISVIPMQLLAYHIAVMRGCNVDQPRNLAKSVTVE